MNARTLQFTAAAALVLGTVSCKKENLSETLERGSAKAIYVNGTASSFANLIAGQNIVAGTLNLDDIDTDNNGLVDALEVTYNTDAGWSLDAIHLWVGHPTTSPPKNRSGNPVPGHYPYKASNIQAGTYTVVIPFSDFGYACDQADHIYMVSAHADLRNTTTNQTEGAWSDGARLTAKGSWAMTTTIEIACDRPPTSNAYDRLEAFAKGSASTCFQDVATCSFEDANWGWTNGPFTPGTYTMDLFASAVDCAGGTDVGNVTVVYNENESATITVTMQGTAPGAGKPYSLFKAWLHVGAAPTPVITQGPPATIGQCSIDDNHFGEKSQGLGNDAASWSTTVNDLSGPIYVSLGALVDGFPKHN
jgi:hypothetical protein